MEAEAEADRMAMVGAINESHEKSLEVLRRELLDQRQFFEGQLAGKDLEIKRLTEEMQRQGKELKQNRRALKGLPTGQDDAEEKTKRQYAKGSILGNMDLEEESDLTVAQQLKLALSKNAGRVIDLFREWDTDGDGTVSRKEFRKALPALGLGVRPRASLILSFYARHDGATHPMHYRRTRAHLRCCAHVHVSDVPKKEIDALFSEWDADGSGSIAYDEMKELLRKSAVATSADKKGVGAGKSKARG